MKTHPKLVILPETAKGASEGAKYYADEGDPEWTPVPGYIQPEDAPAKKRGEGKKKREELAEERRFDE